MTHPIRNRKAISPVLATVILIAITLIAAIAIAGFVFGLFGSFTSTAQVSVTVSSCVFTNLTGATCNLVAANTGTSNAQVSTCSIQLDGKSVAGTITGAPKSLNAGTSGNPLVCVAAYVTPSAGQTSGSQAVGALQLSNGGTASFSGTWQ